MGNRGSRLLTCSLTATFVFPCFWPYMGKRGKTWVRGENMGSGIGSRRHPFDAGTLTDRLTDWPPTDHKGTAIGGRPSHRPTLATHWPKGDGRGRLWAAIPNLRRTGPDWPPTPTPPPADSGLRSGGLPHSPDFRGAAAKGTGRGFCVQRADGHRRPCAPAPLRGPP
jgi:hypothetical protein